ncbi:MAG: alpha-L-fucosidase [Puniceicoccales bacterium]|jgi:alpha-L-fucosidase|nr:alpha-L-fucosidase [Puniceicoccales bacterium]
MMLRATLAVFAALTISANVASTAEPLREPTPSTSPSPAQQAQIDRKYGMFCHFGMNTYAEQEWTDGSFPAETYNPPDDLEYRVDDWVLTARDAGMRYILLTSKHHDGFCLWDSKFTDYDVGNEKVKNHTDVIAAVAKACKKYDIGLAFYYSIWDRNQKFPNAEAYKKYTLGQLEELMSNYGPICELWLDGGWVAKPDYWHVPEIYDLVKRLQPNCVVSTNWTTGAPGDPEKHMMTPDKQAAGDPIRYFPSDFRLADPYMPVTPDPKIFTHNGKEYYLPFEATVTLSATNRWFAHPKDTQAKSIETLEKMFYIATAQDNVLVFNLPPNKDGDLVPAQKKVLFDLAKKLSIGPGKPFPKAPEGFVFPHAKGKAPGWCLAGATADATSTWTRDAGFEAGKAIDDDTGTRWAAKDKDATLEIVLKNNLAADTLTLHEYGEGGKYRINKFSVEYFDGTDWKFLLSGSSVGANLRYQFMPVQVNRLRIKVSSPSDEIPPSLWEVGLVDSKQ